MNYEAARKPPKPTRKGKSQNLQGPRNRPIRVLPSINRHLFGNPQAVGWPSLRRGCCRLDLCYPDSQVNNPKIGTTS
jgi:hypothetical protein